MANRRVDKQIREVLRREGGFVNDPSDRGGVTKFGITWKTWVEFQISQLTEHQAIDIYRQVYWYNAGVHMLPIHLQPIMFDMNVHHGRRNATKILQRTIGHVKVDGILGPKTLRAANEGDVSVGEVVEERVEFMCQIVENDPTQRRFINGWLARARSFEEEE